MTKKAYRQLLSQSDPTTPPPKYLPFYLSWSHIPLYGPYLSYNHVSTDPQIGKATRRLINGTHWVLLLVPNRHFPSFSPKTLRALLFLVSVSKLYLHPLALQNFFVILIDFPLKKFVICNFFSQIRK